MSALCIDGELHIFTTHSEFSLTALCAELRAIAMNLRVNDDTPLTRLYDLVDCHENGHIFSTLSKQIEYLRAQCPGDAEELLALLQDSICTAWFMDVRDDLKYHELWRELSYPKQPKCYSRLYRHITSQSADVATVREWKTRLGSMVKQGLSWNELKWSGLMDYLNTQKNDESLSGAELASEFHLWDMYPVLLVVNDSLEPATQNDKSGDLFPDENPVPDVINRSYMKYSLLGGENYTEWLVTLPANLAFFSSHHYPYRNILMHIRTSERMVEGIGRVLYLDELQSDWNQLGRITGFSKLSEPYDENPPHNPYEKGWVDLGLRMLLVMAAEKNLKGICWSPGIFQAKRYGLKENHPVVAFYDQVVTKHISKLAACWNVRLRAMDIPTLTRRFHIRRDKDKNYRVYDTHTKSIVLDAQGDESLAWRFRLSRESKSCESVTGIIFNEKMHDDLVKDGLPFMGNINLHSATTKQKAEQHTVPDTKTARQALQPELSILNDLAYIIECLALEYTGEAKSEISDLCDKLDKTQNPVYREVRSKLDDVVIQIRKYDLHQAAGLLSAINRKLWNEITNQK